MREERIEWIMNYLNGKTARMEDFKTFFKIQNDESRIKIKEVEKKKHYTYQLNDITFGVKYLSTEKSNMFKVEEIYYMSN